MINKLGYNNSHDNEILFLNNTLKEEPYVPEYEKYGGKAGIEIAESVFIESSKLCLQLLKTKLLDSSYKLGTCFLMLCLGLKAFQVSYSNMLVFLTGYYTYWLHYHQGEKSVILKEWDNNLKCIETNFLKIIKIVFEKD